MEDLELLPAGGSHYTGNMVLQRVDGREIKDRHGKNYSVHDVVDGQQRLTTFILPLDGIRRELREIGEPDLATGIYDTFIAVLDRNGQPIPRLTLNRDLRTTRPHCKLPPAFYEELKASAGPTYVFERFSEQLRDIYARRGESAHARVVKDYISARLKRWIQDEAKLYFATTGRKRFKLHNLRATAMTRAREVGIPVDEAAVAFGCNLATMKQYYLAPDEEAIADSVFDRLVQ